MTSSCFPVINSSVLVAGACLGTILLPTMTMAQDDQSLPIADAHVHYSHDSVELTPPERVIEIMREANLKFALVSSSDDNGTQLLSELAPDLIVPGLRPYRRRGETRTWFTDVNALQYVERLLKNNAYASIGEFHLYGEEADLEIPRRIVELADEYNLILHAHSDADAVERLLAQSKTVRIIWAHSGFESPDEISAMLSRHDRLWADLAFRQEVGSGGLSKDWRQLFEDHPDRMMLGTDTYTPERMYFIPEHAASVRTWLDTLPPEVAENVAWKNAHSLIMPVWQANNALNMENNGDVNNGCMLKDENSLLIQSDQYEVVLTPLTKLKVSQPTSVAVTVCGTVASIEDFKLDASMPAHGHGTNYSPTVSLETISDTAAKYTVDGVVLHMPGTWQWEVEITDSNQSELLTQEFDLN